MSALYAIRSLKRSWATCAWRRVQTIVIVVQLQPFPRLSIDVIPSVVFLFEGTITQQLASCLSSATHRPSGHGRLSGRPRRSNYVPKTEEGSSYFLIFYGAPARGERGQEGRQPARSALPHLIRP